MCTSLHHYGCLGLLENKINLCDSVDKYIRVIVSYKVSTFNDLIFCDRNYCLHTLSIILYTYTDFKMVCYRIVKTNFFHIIVSHLDVALCI